MPDSFLGSLLPTDSSADTDIEVEIKEGRWLRYVPYAPLAIGLVTGGFIARLVLEGTGRPLPWPLVLAVGLLGGIAGAFLFWQYLAVQAGYSGWPLLLLGIYLVWPRRDPTLALQVLALAGLTLLLTWRRWPVASGWGRRWEWLANGLTFGLSLLVYGVTTAPGVLPADSGEFQIVVPLLGVAHPPGYALYTLAGRTFTLLMPWASPAYALNLMSAFLAAGTLTLLGAATRAWARQMGASRGAALAGGVAAALTLGSATTFWAQAGIANIRMPTAFFAALGFYALARYAGADRKADRWLWLLALALGLGLGHHPSLGFLGLFFLLYLTLVDPRLLIQPRRWLVPLAIVGLSLLPLLYLPWRGAAGAVLAPPGLDTWGGFRHHVTAQGFEGDMFAFATREALPRRLALLPTLFRFQFNPGLLLAAALGGLLLLWRDRKLLALLAGGLVLHTFVSITYRAPQTVEYLMPAYLPLAILVGLAAAGLLAPFAFRLSPLSRLLAAGILLAGLNNGLAHGPSYVTLARGRSTRNTVEALLHQAPPEAVILSDWHWVTPLWYLQWVEGQRPDVTVDYVWPVPGQEYGDTWRDRIAMSDPDRPLLLTHAYDLAGYVLEPVGPGYRVHARPYTRASDAWASSEFEPLEAVFETGEDRMRLLGYRLWDAQSLSGETIQAGCNVEVTLAWQATGSFAHPPSFVVQLLDAEGRRLTQDDHALLGTEHAPGEVRFTRLVLPVYPEILPGAYRLAVQVYHQTGEGFETWSVQGVEGTTADLELASLSVTPGRQRPVTLHPLSVPFAGGPRLVGVDYDRSVAGLLRLYLHWRGPAQGGEQVQVNVAHGADGANQPVVTLPPLAGDAYQTLTIDLPADLETAQPGELELVLVSPEGAVLAAGGPWGGSWDSVRLPPAPATARFVPLGDEMALVGVRPAPPATFERGEALDVRLTFLALKPLVSDNSVSVRWMEETGRWLARHDKQPALGALPTLKWIRGSRVVDPHPFEIPADVNGDLIQAEMVVYEAFRGTPLYPLDGRMRRVPLGAWQLSE